MRLLACLIVAPRQGYDEPGFLVWGFFCQEVSAERRIFFPSSVSLFDMKACFFVSDPKPSRAGAVKAGRLFGDQL
jgi:hypothetical protein